MPDAWNREELKKFARTRKVCVCHNLRRSSRAVTRLYDEALAPTGLHANQMAILVSTALADRPTISGLAQEMAMDPSTLSRNLRPLKRDGLIKVKARPKQRHKELALTAKGVKRLKEALPLWTKVQIQLVQQMKPGQWEEVVATLTNLAPDADAIAERL